MIILKHVEYKIKDMSELEGLLKHLDETTSKVQGITLQEICFPRGKEEFVLILDCTTENRYQEWREICPPPPGANDWYEVFLTKDEYFTK
jgi:hypothetical protein